MSEDKNQQKTGKQLLNDTQEAAERARLLREMNPTSAQLETELKREKRKHSYNRALRSTLYTLLVVAAVAGADCNHGHAHPANHRHVNDAGGRAG